MTALPGMAGVQEGALKQLRPPAVPLVACDPYFSIWSPADKLNESDTTHWTGRPHRLSSTVSIDGVPYRIMGGNSVPGAALPQKSLSVLPTRSIYSFEGAGISVTLTFMTPSLPEDLDLLSRPVTYLTYDFHSIDGKSHAVRLSFDALAELAVDTPEQEVVWSEERIGGLTALKVGSREQNVLGRHGDDLRIDWGYFYVVAETSQLASARIADLGALRNNTPVVEPRSPAPAGSIAAVLSINVGCVFRKPVSRWLMLAYDDLYSIQYMQRNLRPYWRRNGWEAEDLLRASAMDYDSLVRRCAAFDRRPMGDLATAGGGKYAQICALAYRQFFAAGKFAADANGNALSFCKENHSNGCISTSDVFYPMAPQFLLFGPSLTKSFLLPFMDYAASARWAFPFAPHDLGTYPKANGQAYGGGDLLFRLDRGHNQDCGVAWRPRHSDARYALPGIDHAGGGGGILCVATGSWEGRFHGDYTAIGIGCICKWRAQQELNLQPLVP